MSSKLTLTDNVFVHKAQFDAGELITQREVVGLSQDFTFLKLYLPNEEGTEGKICPVIESGIVTLDTLVSDLVIFSLCVVALPEVFVNVISAQFPYRF